MAATIQSTVLLIAGMKDNTGREALISALEHVGGVQEVDVNLYHARATIRHSAGCETGELLRVISEAGFGARTAE